MAQQKPTKQQVEQGKAREGGYGKDGKRVPSMSDASWNNLKKVAAVASLAVPVGDAVALARAAKAGKAIVEKVSAREASRIATQKVEKPYVRTTNVVHGKNANVNVGRGKMKVSPPTNTPVKIQKVVEPASSKNVNAAQNRSDARIASAKNASNEAKKVAKAKLVRSAPGGTATAAVILDSDKKQKGTQAGHHVTDSKNHTKPVK